MAIFNKNEPPMLLPTEAPSGGIRALTVELLVLVLYAFAFFAGFSFVTFLFAAMKLSLSVSGPSLWNALAITWQLGVEDFASRFRCDLGMSGYPIRSSFFPLPLAASVGLYWIFSAVKIAEWMLYERNALRFLGYVLLSIVSVLATSLLFPGGCIALGGLLPGVGGSLLRQSDFIAAIIAGPFLLGVCYIAMRVDLARWRRSNDVGTD